MLPTMKKLRQIIREELENQGGSRKPGYWWVHYKSPADERHIVLLYPDGSVANMGTDWDISAEDVPEHIIEWIEWVGPAADVY